MRFWETLNRRLVTVVLSSYRYNAADNFMLAAPELVYGVSNLQN